MCRAAELASDGDPDRSAMVPGFGTQAPQVCEDFNGSDWLWGAR